MNASQQGHSEATVVVLIEKSDGTHVYRTWRRIRCLATFKANRRYQYETEFPGCKVSFGQPLWTNHYGAH